MKKLKQILNMVMEAAWQFLTTNGSAFLFLLLNFAVGSYFVIEIRNQTERGKGVKN